MSLRVLVIATLLFLIGTLILLAISLTVPTTYTVAATSGCLIATLTTFTMVALRLGRGESMLSTVGIASGTAGGVCACPESRRMNHCFYLSVSGSRLRQRKPQGFPDIIRRSRSAPPVTVFRCD